MVHLTENKLIETLILNTTMDAAYEWLISKGDEAGISSRQWEEIKPQIKEQLISGEYSFSVQTRVQRDNETFDLWAAPDHIVLKALTLILEPELKKHVSARCYHLGGQGGSKAAVHETREYLEVNKDNWVMQSDVEGYYAQINHHNLYSQLEELIPAEKYILRLLWQYMNRVIYDGGNYLDVDRGISLDCSLSPLMAALYLKPLDTALEDTGGFYARFMDDWVLIVPTRWQLRKAVKEANTCLTRLGLVKHPEKTFIGRSEKGFDFLGYHLTPHELTVSKRATKRRDEKIAGLYEQGADENRVGQYVSRWQQWARAGVGVVAGVSGVLGATAIAQSATAQYSFPTSEGPNTLNLDGVGGPVSFSLSCSVLTTTPKVHLFATFFASNRFTESYLNTYNSIAFGGVSGGAFTKSFLSDTEVFVPAGEYYFRVVTTDGYYGWVTVADDCTLVSFVGETSLNPSLMPDGTGLTITNVPPTTLALDGDFFTYTENDPATVIDQSPFATVSDSDSANFNGGNLTATITSGEDAAEDILSLDTSGTVAMGGTTAGSNISVGGTVVGTLGNHIAAGNDLLIFFNNANATPARAQTLVRAITYENNDITNPTTGARNVRVTVNDGDGGTSANNDVTVTVQRSNDAPTATGIPTDVTVTEDTASNLNLSSVTFADVDGDSLTVTLTASAGTMAATTGGSVTIGGSGTGTLTLTGAVGNINTYLATASNIQYTGASNANGNDVATLTINANDTTVNPQLGTVNIDITAQNDAPTATGIPTDVTVTEDTASNLNLSPVTFADVDGDNLTVTLTASAGAMTASSGGGVTVGGAGTGILSLEGTAANINTFLVTASNIQYTGANNASGNDAATLTINANDSTVNPQLGTVKIDITAQNDAPTFTGTPIINGIAKVGQTLNLIDTGTNDVDSDTVSLSYQWKADGVGIGIDSTTYTLTAAEKGKTITCTITADDSKGGVTTFTTAGVEVKSSFSWHMFLPSLISPNKVSGGGQ